MSEENLRKIAISEETFEKLTADFIEHLKNEEKIELVVVSAENLHPGSMHRLDVSGVILAQDEAEKYKKELEMQEKIIEYQNMSSLDNIEKMIEQMDMLTTYVPERMTLPQKQKYYVPRTIGKPNPKKKGGR